MQTQLSKMKWASTILGRLRVSPVEWIDQSLLSSYHFRARVRPVLLATISPAVAGMLWARGEEAWLQFLGAGVVLSGVAYVLGEWAGDKGREKQGSLWEAWGGAPTSQLLRYRDSKLNPRTLERIRQGIVSFCPDVELPSRDQEAKDPALADEVYATCIDRIRVLFREHSMVKRASIAYGFRRNLWAIRGWGIVGSAVSILAGGSHLYVYGITSLGVATVVVACMAGLGFVRATSDWVKGAAWTYARRLLEAAEAEAGCGS